jgi:hypothetical protein
MRAYGLTLKNSKMTRELTTFAVILLAMFVLLWKTVYQEVAQQVSSFSSQQLLPYVLHLFSGDYFGDHSVKMLSPDGLTLTTLCGTITRKR